MEISYRDVIEQYVNPRNNDVKKLAGYIATHEIITNEVFRLVAKDNGRRILDTSYCHDLDREGGFLPVDRDRFIRRVPFYYYEEQTGTSSISPLGRFLPIVKDNVADGEKLEELYVGMEHLFYELHIPLADIFKYPFMQLRKPSTVKKPYKDENGKTIFPVSIPQGLIDSYTDDMGMDIRELMFRWIHYVKLCDQLKWLDFMPERLVFKYNEALEASGLDPIIYLPLKHNFDQYFIREAGNAYSCYGNFPCDEKGRPAMKWIGVRVENPGTITFDGEKSRRGKLRIGLTPATRIFAKGIYNEEDDSGDIWYQVYAGPLTMEFDYGCLKEYRTIRGMTQRQVAEAIGASVRTYQKWENGETTPDGIYMLRLMNWLDIQDAQSLVAYKDYIRKEAEKE